MMESIKTIVVPTDFSEPAGYALRYAVRLARAFDASIILYHAFIPFESGFYPADQSRIENQAEENVLIAQLTKIKGQLLRSHGQLNCSAYVDRGPARLRLMEFTEKRKVDLIVMGTKGASGAKEAVIGSFTADVMISAPCPVMAIPEKQTFRIPRRIVFSSAYHEKDVESLKFLLLWKEMFKAKIRILHISDPEQVGEDERFSEYKKIIEKHFGEKSFAFQQVESDEILRAILHSTLNDKTDILAFLPVKREGIWYRLFHKDLIKNVAYHIRLPLLSIPAR